MTDRRKVQWGEGYKGAQAQAGPVNRPANSQGQGGRGGAGRPQQGVVFGQGYNRGANRNRFAALANDTGQPQAANQQNARQDGRSQRPPQQPGKQAVDWRRAVEHDIANEKPPWPFTCYSHVRSQPGVKDGGGPNDLEGDFCFEELRLAQMQAAAGGAAPQQLAQEFGAGQHAQQQQLQALMRARQPPAEGGPPLPRLESLLPASHSLRALGSGPSAGVSAFGPPATPFGQVVGAFGAQPSVAAQPFQAPIAQPALGQPALGQPSLQPAFGGGNLQPGIQAPGTTRPSLSSGSGNLSEDEKAWLADAFEPGKIPDSPPPPQYC